MTFTYDSADLSTDLAKVRLIIGDTVQNEGPRPGTGTNTNFTDEELAIYVGVELLDTSGWAVSLFRVEEL